MFRATVDRWWRNVATSLKADLLYMENINPNYYAIKQTHPLNVSRCVQVPTERQEEEENKD